MMNLSAQALMEQATQITGLTNFGDPSFRAGLERLIASINKEAVPTQIGEQSIPQHIIGILVNRLQVEECYRVHPEIEDEEITRPLFISGLPRTGSTALGHMLALDDGTRSLRGWEAAKPCPPPDIRVQNDPRIAAHLQNLAQIEAMAPGIMEALPFNEHAPDECFVLLDLTFANIAFDGYYHVPDYENWVLTQGLPEVDAAYEYHKRVIKLLQWKTPAQRWVLRSPVHSIHMKALHKVYPDARFIMTHRKPEKVLPSICLLINLLRECFLQNPLPNDMAVRQVNQWELGLRRLMQFRDEIGEEYFFDIYHSEQIANPEKGLEKLYEWLDWEFNPAFVDALRSWQKNNPKGKHKPNASAFNLDVKAIRKRFEFYTNRFGERM